MRLLALAALLCMAPMQGAWAKGVPAAPPKAPALGTASNFAALGYAGVTCTSDGTHGVVGNVGSYPSASITGFPPSSTLCTLTGNLHLGDAVAHTAYNDLFAPGAASVDSKLGAMVCPPANNLTGQNLGGKTLAPGVYCFNTGAELTGLNDLTLAGNNTAVWVFQVGTTLTTDTASVVMSGGGLACNVFWRLGSAATIGKGTELRGNILAYAGIGLIGPDASLIGRAFSETASVTMANADIFISAGGKSCPK